MCMENIYGTLYKHTDVNLEDRHVMATAVPKSLNYLLYWCFFASFLTVYL